MKKKFIWNAVFRLIHLKKPNFVHQKSAKNHINIMFINVNTKVKLTKLDIEFA